MIGEAFGANLNVLPPLGVLADVKTRVWIIALISWRRSIRLRKVDTDLLAHAFEWAAAAPTARKEIFNITNGDVFVWQELWAIGRDAFGMKVGAHQPTSVAQELIRNAEQ